MGPTRSAAVGRGLGRVETGSGTLIAYATQPGNVADDGEGRNSPFTGALLAHIATPGLSVDALLARVTDDVMKGTGERQQPWRHSSLRKPFYFKPAPAPTTAESTASATLPPSGGTASAGAAGEQLAARAYEAAERIDTVEAYEAVVRRYPESIYAELAQTHIEKLIAARVEAQAKAEVERRAKAPGQRFGDCAECPEVVVVASGSYMMGSADGEDGRYDDEGPVHRVRIEEPIAVGVTEVTRGEFARFVRETGHSTGDACWTYEDGEWGERSGRNWRSPGYSQTDAHPVVCVSWEDAIAYVRWLSRETGERYRLPSEAEWEYAARGGTETSRYWGDGESGQCAHANASDRALKRRYGEWKWTVASCDDGHVHTAAAGTFSANAYGLHDVMGNVWEWVGDCWNEGYTGAPSNGSAWESGDCARRVMRGGSWFSSPGTCVPRFAAGTPPEVGATMSVSELPGR